MTPFLLIAATLVNGTDCVGNPWMNTTALSPRWTMSLCVRSDVPLCGITYKLDGARVVSRVVFTPSDTTWDITGDLGGTGQMSLPLVATLKMNLATPTIGVYKVRLADVSMVLTCDKQEVPIATTFEVRRK